MSEASHDARLAAIRVEDERNAIPHEDADPVKPHLPREIREYLYSAVCGDSKECVGKRLGYDTERLIRFFRAYHLIDAEPE